MLCSLLKIWETYSIANALFPSSGKMFSTQRDEPVAMMMSYRHREVTIVNQKEFLPCFTTEVASKLNVPVLTIAPDMFKFTTTVPDGNFDHYVFYDENANIKLPPKVEQNKTEQKVTKVIEQFSQTHKTGDDVGKVIASIVGTNVPHTTETQIRDMVKKIVGDEHKKDIYKRTHNHTSVKLRRTLKHDIKRLVKAVIRAHRNRVVTNTKIHSILSIVKHQTPKSKKDSRTKVKQLIQSIIKMNALNAVTPAKIDRMITISRSHRKHAAEKKIKNIIHSIIYTRTNKALTKHTIRQIVNYIRESSGEISDKMIEKKVDKLVRNIITTTVSTIVPVDKVVAIAHLAQKPLPADRITKKIKSLIHDIRVDTDDEKEDVNEDDCPVCKCTFKKYIKNIKHRGKKHPKKWSLSKKGKKGKKHGKKGKKGKKHHKHHNRTLNPKYVEGKQLILIPVFSSTTAAPSQKVLAPVTRNIPTTPKTTPKTTTKKTTIVPSPKKVKALSKKIKIVASKIAQFKKVAKILTKEFSRVKEELKAVESRPVFESLVKKMKTINKKQDQIKTVVAKLNIVKFDASQQKFAASPIGVQASNACKGMGAKGVVLKGCMQDMRLTKDPKIVLNAVKQTVATIKKVQVANKIQLRTGNAPSRTCSASGDPHFTNFNGDYFHIQQESIYTFAKTSDGLFEVQVKQTGSKKAGEPSYVNDVMIRYDGKVYHGSFSKDGFSVRSGGYVSVTVPGSYQGEMIGICGANGPSGGSVNFKLPSGKAADINYGKSNWQLGGYGGPNSKLSKWHLSWRPSLDECMFSRQECQNNLKDQAVNKKRYVMTAFGRIDTSAI